MMKKWQKALKLTGIICLIILASLGVGLGGAPILPKNRARYMDTVVKTELAEVKKENSSSTVEIKE
ncbi:hypothetical protein [Adhaeribacter radiodurans]|uniref:Uncharacterized protein n=1 Tax=Adhaeribacter radiodurans TaxID=2745197 RepID=A0A7L7LDW9_9BACT|nr:hypothetical protein [Adhaeribacter radiodurans]QMU30735.1 hypothetical protein HUW48_23100 [Adhaeribacter radiodurans]